MAYVRLDWAIENRVPSSSIFPEWINGHRYASGEDEGECVSVTNGTLAIFPTLTSF